MTISSNVASPYADRRLYAGWRVVALAFLLQMLATGPVYYAFGNYAVLFQNEFGSSRTEINLGYTLLLTIGALGAAPVGWALDRWDARPVALAGVLMTAIGMASLGLATSTFQVVVLFATLIACGDIMMGMVTTNFLVSRWFERRRGMALGLTVLGASVAAVAFPPLTTFLSQSIGWRTMFFIYGGLICLLALPVHWFGQTPSLMPAEELKELNGDEPHPGTKLPLLDMIKVPAFSIISFVVGTMIGVTGAVTISIVPDAVSKGFSELEAASLVSVLGAGAFVGKISFGVMADRIALHHALALALVIMGLGVALLIPNLPYAALVGACTLFGFSLGGMLPVWGAIVAHVFGTSNCGSALGFTRAAMLPCTMMCPMIAGISFDQSGEYRIAWIAFLSLLLLSLVCVLFPKRWTTPIDLRRAAAT